MAPKLSLAEQKKKLKEKEQRAKDNEKREKEKERGERKAQEQKDKMFGLKNKAAGKAAQEALTDAERALKSIPGEQQKAEAKARENAKRKEAELKAQKEFDDEIRRSIRQPKVPEGVDPKTVLCEYFKMKVCLGRPQLPVLHDFLGKAEVSSQLKDVAANTGAVTKSGAKSKAQLDKEAADAARRGEGGATSRKTRRGLALRRHRERPVPTSTTTAWTWTSSCRWSSGRNRWRRRGAFQGGGEPERKRRVSGL